MLRQQIIVAGASCNHCVDSIETALKKVTGVTHVAMDLSEKIVTVDGEVPMATLIEAITNIGFDAVAK